MSYKSYYYIKSYLVVKMRLIHSQCFPLCYRDQPVSIRTADYCVGIVDMCLKPATSKGPTAVRYFEHTLDKLMCYAL